VFFTLKSKLEYVILLANIGVSSSKVITSYIDSEE